MDSACGTVNMNPVNGRKPGPVRVRMRVDIVFKITFFEMHLMISPPFQGGDLGEVQTSQIYFSCFFEGKSAGPTTPGPSFIRRGFY